MYIYTHDTDTKIPVQASASGVSVTGRTLSLQVRTKMQRVCMSWGYSCRAVIQRTVPRMSTALIRPERSDGSYAWSGTMLSKAACRPIIDNDPSISSQCHPVPTFMVCVCVCVFYYG